MHPDLAKLEASAERIETTHAFGKVVARAWGATEAPWLALTHGSFGAWTHWARNIEALATRWRVLAIDMPGMGDSAAPSEPISAESMGAYVAEAIRQALPVDACFTLADRPRCCWKTDCVGSSYWVQTRSTCRF